MIEERGAGRDAAARTSARTKKGAMRRGGGTSRWMPAAVAALAGVLTLTACDGDVAGIDLLDPDDLDGTYDAQLLEVTVGDEEPVDALDAGADIRLRLNDDGTLGGAIFIPAEITGQELIDEALAGTWSFDENLQRLDLQLAQDLSDLFLDDVVFVARRQGGDVILEADFIDTTQDLAIAVVLRRR